MTSEFYLNPYGIPFLLASIFALFLGGYVFAYGGVFQQRISFLAICASFFLWLFGTFLVYSVRGEDRALQAIYVTYAGVCFIAPSLYWYASAWLGRAAKNKTAIVIGFVLGLLFLSLIIGTRWVVYGAARYFWGYHSRLTIWGGAAYLVFFSTFLFLFFFTLFQGFRDEPDRTAKRRIGLVAGSFLIATLGSSDFLPCYGLEVFPIGGLTLFVALCILGYTIIRYKLFDIETVIHKTIMWFSTTVIAIAPFALLGYWTRDWAQELPPLGATIYLLVLLISFYFYFRAIQPRLDHVFRRRHANLRAVLGRFSEELIHLKDLNDLLSRFGRTVQESIYAREIAVYLREESSNQYVPAWMIGLRDLKPLANHHSFFKLLAERDKIVICDLAAGDPDFASHVDTLRSFSAEMRALLLIPLVLNDELIGFVSLGKKENLKKYTSAEIDFLSQIKSPTTIAISNSQQFENVSKLYQHVQIQNERLKELDRLKSEFLANTSHELRTPLQGILGLVESMLDGADGPVSDVQRTHLRMIVESGSNLKELVNNLLELSRIESGQEQLKIKAFNVLNVIDAAIVLLSSLAHKKKLSLRRIAPAALSDVFGDPEKIQRALVNLAGNAIKFTEKGEVVVRVTEDNDRVAVAVEDTGIGISPEDQKIIFERFRQAEGSTTRRFEGTGLGLSIAREIIRLHGSDIEVRSELGRGSAFSFSLPKTPIAFPEAKVGEPSSETGLTPSIPSKEYSLERDPEFEEAVRGNGEKILIVDDNPVNREVVKTRLELNHYQPIEAVDGIDGIEKMEREKPDLVILDLMMPRMSGYEFCKRVRKEYSPDEAPIIMLTARTEMGDKIYGLQLGANDYIAKPFNKEELVARVAVLLRIRQMSRELHKWNEELEQRVDERTAELVKTQEQLIQAEKLATLGTMAGGVAHEINNPLTAVLTNVQMLKSEAKADDLDSLALIEEGAKRCQAIVQKLMKYARKPSNQELAKELDLNHVIENALSLLSFQLEQEGIQLVKRLNPVPKIKGAPNELEQVFTNILLNAKDAIKAGKGHGTVEIETFEKNGSVCAQIKDDGIGISKEHLSKIFDPFFTTKDVGKGTGLGLSITYGIVEKYGGRIQVLSEVGKGSTFELVFPKTKL